MLKTKNILILSLSICISVAIICCNTSQKKQESDNTNQYLNLNDSAQYVGINTCKLCHQNIFNTFIKTGMGESFDIASKHKSAALFDKHYEVIDSFLRLNYAPYWQTDTLIICEYQLQGQDTSYKRTEKIDYIVGSGQHTNSHLINVNGYLYQAPLTFYTQKKKWDLPPGFEKGFNSRFSRKIGLECMSCHNAYPKFVLGSENKFNDIPNGIDCERCHGPGSVHVKQKQSGILVDTSKQIDYSIVNPAKLPIDKLFDVCQRCHLQGNAVLKEGKSFFDFKPGMNLSDVLTVFMPKYEHGENDFIMASHADRLKQSQCFIKSFKPSENKVLLKPYQQSLTCINCHNPHVSVKATKYETFNAACKNCHNQQTKVECSRSGNDLSTESIQNNCISCHMPKSGSIDIPHVSITDHFIRKPLAKGEIEKVKKFIGLFAINETNPDSQTIAQAYLNQFEKFDSNAALLDSAQKYLSDNTLVDVNHNLNQLIHLNFLKNNYEKIIYYTKLLGEDKILNRLTKISFDNKDAWMYYRIGEAYQYIKGTSFALIYYKKAVALAPFNLEFNIKMASSFFSINEIDKAKKIYEYIIKENPKYTSAYCNLGYCYFKNGNYSLADKNFDIALLLDPNYLQAILNKIQLLIVQKKYAEAKLITDNALKYHPNDEKIKQVVVYLKSIYK